MEERITDFYRLQRKYQKVYNNVILYMCKLMFSSFFFPFFYQH